MHRAAVLVRTVLLLAVVCAVGVAPGTVSSAHRRSEGGIHRASAHVVSVVTGVHRAPTRHSLTRQRGTHQPGAPFHTDATAVGSAERQDRGTNRLPRTRPGTTPLSTRPLSRLHTRAPPD